MKTPVRLDTVPIFEASFEVRFVPESKDSAELLPGMMLPKLSSYVQRLENLSAADIPRAIAATERKFQYTPARKLVGEKYQLAFGPRILALSVQRPYPGWSQFRSVIDEVLSALKGTDQFRSAERYSLKYRNLVEANEDSSDLEKLNVDLRVGNFNTRNATQRIHCETELEGFRNLITILTKTQVVSNVTNEKLSGVLIDVDTISTEEFGDFWSEIDEALEKAHNVEKEVFFDLLTKQTIDELGPVWE